MTPEAFIAKWRIAEPTQCVLSEWMVLLEVFGRDCCEQHTDIVEATIYVEH